MRCNFEVLLACCCVTLFGCSAQPVFVPLPTTHPASPWACESPVAVRSDTLSINKGEKVPPHPDWQIPGMRDDELHGHAAGQPSAMDMMGHGHMMMGGAHGAMSGGEHGSMDGGDHAPGMVKMSAPPGKVDYAPEGAVHPSGAEPHEHEPEMHLDHTDPQRRKAGFKAAPLAPPMQQGESETGHEGHEGHESPEPSKDHEGHKGHEMPKKDSVNHEAPAAKDTKTDKAAPMDHEAMGHIMDQGESVPAKETPKPEATPPPAMDHSNHGA